MEIAGKKPRIPALREEDFQDGKYDDDHLEPGGQIDAYLHIELQCTHTSEEVKASIAILSNEKIISNDVKTGLLNLHNETLKRPPTLPPMLQKIEKESEKKEALAKLKHDNLVEVNQNGKKFYIQDHCSSVIAGI